MLFRHLGILGLFLIAQPSRAGECTNFYPAVGPYYTGVYSPARLAPPTRIKVVSYNVAVMEKSAQVLADLQRLPALQGADVILLQEASGLMGGPTNDIEPLARALRMNYLFAPAMTLWGKDYGNAILSRWPMARVRKVLLPLSGKEQCNQRIAVGVDLQIGKNIVQVYSVHLSTQFPDTLGGEASRAAQLAVAVHSIDQSPDVPAVISGDMNTYNPLGTSKLLKMMEGDRFSNAHPSGGPTFRTRSVELDRAFVRGMATVADGTAREAQGSDHFPIWFTLDLNSRN